MALVLAYEDAKTHQYRNVKDLIKGVNSGHLHTPFFGSRDNPDYPHAAFAEWDPGHISRAHYHANDQFQVIVDGKGTIGRHELAPYSVHFSRAYTPYGPLVADASHPMAFFGLRAHYDPGSQTLREKQDQLKQIANREPWQITRRVTFASPKSHPSAPDTTLTDIADIKDERGLAVYTLSMKPNVNTCAPDPRNSDGQYLIVVEGSLWHDDKEHTALTLVFVFPHELPFQLCAGSDGLRAIVLNFPRRHDAARGAPDNASNARIVTSI